MEYRLGGTVYLLHDGSTEQFSPDRSWVWREATADRLDPGAGRVRLRQVQVRRPLPAAKERHSALRAQAEMLSQVNGRARLPRLIDVCEDRELITVVTVHPPGLPWAEVFGPGPSPPDRLTAAAALVAAADLCTSLGVLHERTESHRALHPHGIFVDRRQECGLRDVGLAVFPSSPGEGEVMYRAPEQTRAPYRTGAYTDVYQLAAIVYHTLTGHPPTPAKSPPVRAVLPEFPEVLDRTLLLALGNDPDRRPSHIRALAGALRQGRRALSGAGAR